MAQVDYFLKIADVAGESADDKHKGEIDISSWGWGVTSAGTMAHGGGGGAGKVSVQNVHFSMRVNKASPKLINFACIGQHIKECTLTCRKAGKEQQEYLKIKFTDSLVTSYQTGGHGGEIEGNDDFTLDFAKFEYEYSPQKADGTLEGAVRTGYDVKANKPV